MTQQDLRTRSAAGIAMLVALLSIGSLAGCGSPKAAAAAPGGQFVAGSKEYPLSCMEHQPTVPGPGYTSADGADTAVVLEMLRYYTANKDVVRYCDGKAPNAIDRRWAQAYVDLGAEPANVAHILATSATASGPPAGN